MKKPLFTGCAAALVTPFKRDETCDDEAFLRLIAMQKAAGMDALVLLGTTGEASTLSMNERERLITLGIQAAGNSMPVIVGIGSNDTKKAIEYARQAGELGACGGLCVTPYYNKSTQTGLIRHFSSIADSSSLPIIIYNVPSRTGMSILPETAEALSSHPQIAGIKEASGNVLLSAEIIQRTGSSLPVYAGNDDLILPLMAQGAVGAISVIANILPAQVRAITSACLTGRFGEARSAQEMLLPLIELLFSQVNPIPIKAALSALDLIEDQLRLPLTPMEEPYRGRLIAQMRKMKILHHENLS